MIAARREGWCQRSCGEAMLAVNAQGAAADEAHCTIAEAKSAANAGTSNRRRGSARCCLAGLQENARSAVVETALAL